MRKLVTLLALMISAPSWAQSVNPPHQTSTPAVTPQISAAFPDRVRKARIWVDGTEFTAYLQTRDNVVYLNPPYPLDYGNHHVRVQTDRQQVAWNFAIINPNGRYSPGYHPGNPNQGYSYPGYPNQGYQQPGGQHHGYYHPGYKNQKRKPIRYDNKNKKRDRRNDQRRRDWD